MKPLDIYENGVAPSMSSFEMEITPAQAKEFLLSNQNNRTPRRTWVASLADIIRRGQWKVTHQGIALDRNNRLIDGQHRLLAVIESGIAVRMMVSFDCDPATFDVIDGGVKRSAADHLRIPHNQAAVAAQLHRISVNGYGTRVGYPAPDQMAAVMRDCGTEIAAVCQGAGGLFGTAPIRAAVVVHMRVGNKEAFEHYTLMRQLELEHLHPAERSFAKQVIEKKIRNAWEAAARAWRAFHPDHAHAWKLTIKDIGVPLEEMCRAYQIVSTITARHEAAVRASRPSITVGGGAMGVILQ